MSTPYGISTSIGSQTFSGFVNAPVQGPLNSNNFPCAMPYHSYGSLSGRRPTVPQFYPGQEPVAATMNTNARRNYSRAYGFSNFDLARQKLLHHDDPPLSKAIYSSQRKVPVSSHVNYIPPVSGGMYTEVLKSIAVGKSSYKIGLPLAAPITTKSHDASLMRSSLRRARSGGCTAPRKKGSVYNYSLTQPGICAWGSIPRQNY